MKSNERYKGEAEQAQELISLMKKAPGNRFIWSILRYVACKTIKTLEIKKHTYDSLDAVHNEARSIGRTDE